MKEEEAIRKKEKVAANDLSFVDAVSMQGLQPIMDPTSSWCRKILWVLVVLFALCFTTYNISKQVIHYCSSPISVEMDIIRAVTLPFPTVTICNFNFMRASAVIPIDADLLLRVMKPMGYRQKESAPNYDNFNFAQYNTSGAWEHFYRSMGHTLTSDLIQCRWEHYDCGAANFTSTFTDFGLCFVFNADGKLEAKNSGRDYGLRISLNVGQSEYLRSFNDHYGAGYKVAVHPSGVPPILSDKGVSVSPGFYNSLAVNIQKLKNAPQSVSKCGSRPLKYFVNESYSTQACRLDCLTDFVVKECGCRDISMPGGNTTDICDPPKLYSCLFPKGDEYVKSWDKSCEKTCPDPCDTFVFDTTPSAAPLSNYFLNDYANFTGRSPDYWKSNFVELEVFLTSMSYQFIQKHVSYSMLDLLCDVGGALGLLLGASFLTVLEIVDYLVMRTRRNKQLVTHIMQVKSR